jgi:DNA polymerase III subunit epsilon
VDRGVTDDPDYRSTTFLFLDFETTTPKGTRPEPIEVAAVAAHPTGSRLVETLRYGSLIRPPSHAPVTPFDTDQTGITPQDVASAPPAAQVLAELDAALPDTPCLLVAHNAPYEASLLYDFHAHCPRLAATHLIDTVRLARAVLPGLPSYGLDHLMYHLRVPRPAERHRALPDVLITVELFTRLVHHGARHGHWSTLRELQKAAGVVPRCALPQQGALF